MSAGVVPPTQAQCNAINRRCFNPASMQNSYNLPPLYAQGLNGRGVTIAIVDSFGSLNIAGDLNVFNNAFGLQHMGGEANYACAPGDPTFSQLAVQGSPSPVTTANGHQENRAGWDLEVSLDVEWAHAIAPQANILLVTTPTA